MKNYTEVQKLLNNYFNSLSALKKAGVTSNKKDFTSQIGEWLVCEIFSGERAISGIQKYWDIKVDDKRLQVKTHSKSFGNNNRWSAIKHDVDAEIDELIIVVFDEGYELKEFYQIPWKDALNYIKKGTSRDIINWDHVSSYKIPLIKLPNQDVVRILRAGAISPDQIED